MRVKAIIKLDNFKENIKSVRMRIGDNRLICVPVKADAYGHGAFKIAEASLSAGADYLGVAAVAEGVELRRGGIKTPILIFSQPNPDEIPQIIKENLIPFISDIEFASILNEQVTATNKRFAEVLGSMAQNVQLPVHIKIDTGMGRMGCSVEESLDLARHITSCQGLKLAGIATHLAVSDSTEERDINYTYEQLSRFKNAIDAIRAEGIDPGIVHAANSGAVILHPGAWLDMVRPGILLYGYKAAEENDIHTKGTLLQKAEHIKELSNHKPVIVKPVMEFRTSVMLIKKIKKGDSVSYGRTWTADKDTFIAVLSAGYADGIPRLASNKWQAVINGETYPITGRICMDQCCVDLGAEPRVKRWDEAVIFGGQAKSAAALAEVTGTIPYEITCNVSKRVAREYA